jgi:hypothetical protein
MRIGSQLPETVIFNGSRHVRDTDQYTCDKKDRNKMPPKPGNTNALKHGLTSGTLPAGCSHILAQTNTFENAVKCAAIERRGDLDVFTSAGIQTAVSWYKHALLARHWLKTAYETLTHDQRLSFSREAARALAERDKTLRSLGLDRCENDAPNVIYSLPAPTGDGTEGQTNAPLEPGQSTD